MSFGADTNWVPIEASTTPPAKTMQKFHPKFQAWLLKLWGEALAIWGFSISLSPAMSWVKNENWSGSDPIAYITLNDKQVWVNYDFLRKGKLLKKSTKYIFAHEIGHHMKYPGTLKNSAKLKLMQRELVPRVKTDLTNLFEDLLINQHVIEALGSHEPHTAVDRSVLDEAQKNPNDLFSFYQCCYETLWGLPFGYVAGPVCAAQLEKNYPRVRRELKQFVDRFFFEMSNETMFTRFTYFCSVIEKYYREDQNKSSNKKPKPGTGAGTPTGAGEPSEPSDPNEPIQVPRPSKSKSGPPMSHDTPEPTAVDYTDAIFERGKLDGDIANLPEDIKKPVMKLIYKRLVEQYLFEPPRRRPPPEPEIPTGVAGADIWDVDLASIDWIYTMGRRGHPELAGAMGVYQREYEPDVQRGAGRGAVPPVEIYLDTSGSMPNPFEEINAMTVAALVVGVAAVRHGARVRSVVFSVDWIISPWLYGEEAVYDALLGYVGGGTQFPFDFLEQSAKETVSDPAIRVLVSDSDFYYNLHELVGGRGRQALRSGLSRFLEPVKKSDVFVALLHVHDIPQEISDLSKETPKFQAVQVKSLKDFGPTAAALAKALFPPGLTR